MWDAVSDTKEIKSKGVLPSLHKVVAHLLADVRISMCSKLFTFYVAMK